MKILVLGANGRTGKLVVDYALSRGHQVAGLVKSSWDDAPANVKVVVGDVNNYEDIYKALPGIDVVISTVGHVKGSDKRMQTNMIDNIIRAIGSTDYGIKIVSLTGTGVRLKGDMITPIDLLLNIAVKVLDSNRVKDGTEHFKHLQESSINWSVVRVLKLTSGNSMQYRLSENGPAKTFVSRLEVARALVEVAESSSWDKKAPIIRNV